jgi:hypothetical protein
MNDLHIAPCATEQPSDRRRDHGGVLPLVLVAVVTFSMVVGSLAGYVATGLRYGNVVEERANRLAAADAGLRFSIERLRNLQDLCTTGIATGDGFTRVFPPKINGADTEVTCRRTGTGFDDIQGWGLVVTGAGVPANQNVFTVQGAGGAENNVKTFRGPMYISDPTRIDLSSNLILQDGDLWYSAVDCSAPITIPGLGTRLRILPEFLRGTVCVDQTWNNIFRSPAAASAPTAAALAAPTAPPDDTTFPGCRVFSPGRYTNSLPLGANNYFKAGDYYFENVDVQLQDRSLLAGFPGRAGDTPKVNMPECNSAMLADQASLRPGGATFWLGGSSRFHLRTGGRLEIFRRQQVAAYVSLVSVRTDGPGYIRTSNSFEVSAAINPIFETNSGNNNDGAVHGLIWAPHSRVVLGNVTNSAVGQVIGGLVVGQVHAQASNSATAFSIGIESNPAEAQLLLESTATKNGSSTSIRAVVQFRPETKELAVNSWRVVG